MLWGILAALVIWLVAVPVLFFLAAFVHELGHFVTAKISGLEVVGYRLVSVPGNAGYVDVRINSRDPLIIIKRVCLHGAGPASHLLQVIMFGWFMGLSTGVTLNGVFVIGILVNLYLLLNNLFAEESDGLLLYKLYKSRC